MSIISCLVTGGTGFLGRHVVAALSESGRRVTNLSRKSVTGMEVIAGDLSAPELDLGQKGFDEVYHLAGLAHRVPTSQGERDAFLTVNAQGTARLLTSLERTGSLPQRLVFSSTVAVYGCDEGELLGEETPLLAVDPYGLSKRQAEDLLLEWGDRHGICIGIARLPLLAGANPLGNLGAMIAGLRRGFYLGVGDGSARRSMVMAGDVAAILPALGHTGGIFHLTDGRHPSYAELEQAICTALDRSLPLRLPLWLAQTVVGAGDRFECLFGRCFPLNRRMLAKMTSTLTFSDSRAHRQLGWNPVSVIDTLPAMLSSK